MTGWIWPGWSTSAQLVFSRPPKVTGSVLIIHPASVNQQPSEQRSFIRPVPALRWEWRGRDGIISRMLHHRPQYNGAHLISIRANIVLSLGINHLWMFEKTMLAFVVPHSLTQLHGECMSYCTWRVIWLFIDNSVHSEAPSGSRGEAKLYSCWSSVIHNNFALSKCLFRPLKLFLVNICPFTHTGS